MDGDCRRMPKFLTARCVMLAYITGRERPSSSLAFGSTEARLRESRQTDEWSRAASRLALWKDVEMTEGLLTMLASFFIFTAYRLAVYFRD